jgi:hypothetical protein
VKEKQLCEVITLPKTKENIYYNRNKLRQLLLFASIPVILLLREGTSMTLSVARPYSIE